MLIFVCCWVFKGWILVIWFLGNVAVELRRGFDFILLYLIMLILIAIVRCICLSKLLISKDKIQIFIQSRVFRLFQRTLPKLLKTIHLPRFLKRWISWIRFYSLNFLRKIKINRKTNLLKLLRNHTPPSQPILSLNQQHHTIIFLLYSLEYEALNISTWLFPSNPCILERN